RMYRAFISSPCPATSVTSVRYYLSRTVFLPVLHSFPTRRSSDLHGAGRARARPRCPRAPRRSANDRRPGRGRHAIGLGGPRRRRSEEHTSELQSRENLVCRLLLVKKKT